MWPSAANCEAEAPTEADPDDDRSELAGLVGDSMEVAFVGMRVPLAVRAVAPICLNSVVPCESYAIARLKPGQARHDCSTIIVRISARPARR